MLQRLSRSLSSFPPPSRVALERLRPLGGWKDPPPVPPQRQLLTNLVRRAPLADRHTDALYRPATTTLADPDLGTRSLYFRPGYLRLGHPRPDRTNSQTQFCHGIHRCSRAGPEQAGEGIALSCRQLQAPGVRHTELPLVEPGEHRTAGARPARPLQCPQSLLMLLLPLLTLLPTISRLS